VFVGYNNFPTRDIIRITWEIKMTNIFSQQIPRVYEKIAI